MHYKDGTEAKIGDIVKGKGYNRKNEKGELKTIVGTLVQATPGATSCNCMVAFMDVDKVVAPARAINRHFSTNEYLQVAKDGLADGSGGAPDYLLMTPDYDYGQLDHFELVYRPE